MPRIDARVEQSDRDARSVEPGDADPDPTAALHAERLRVQRGGGDGGGYAARTGYTPATAGSRSSPARSRVDRRREAVQDAEVRLLRVDRRPARPETCDRAPLCHLRGRRPGAHLELRGGAAGAQDAIGDGRRPQHDDPPPPSSGAGLDPRRPSHPDATSGASVARSLPARDEQRGDGEHGRGAARPANCSSAHRAQGSRELDGGRVPRGRRDHGRVVRAEGERSEASLEQCPSQLGVRRDSADHGERFVAGLLRRGAEPRDERLHDRPLVRRGEIRPAPFELRLGQLADGIEQRGLEPREREVEPRDAGHGERERVRVAVGASRSISAPPG